MRHAGAHYAAWSADSALLAVSLDGQHAVMLWHTQSRAPYTRILFSGFHLPMGVTFLPGTHTLAVTEQQGSCWLAGASHRHSCACLVMHADVQTHHARTHASLEHTDTTTHTCMHAHMQARIHTDAVCACALTAA